MLNNRKWVDVVAAVIENQHQHVLIAKRPHHVHCGDLWEFPGGKIEVGETPEQALHRELNEELGIDIVDCKPLFKVEHCYPEINIALDMWQVKRFSGQAFGKEGQHLLWVAYSDLKNYPFPEANYQVIDYLLS